MLKLIEQKKKFGFSTFPVVDEKGRLVGLLSGHVVKPRTPRRKFLMRITPREQVHNITKRLGKDPIARADKFFSEHIGLHKLLVVDDDDNLHGLITLERRGAHPVGTQGAVQAGPVIRNFASFAVQNVSATRNAFRRTGPRTHFNPTLADL